MSSVEAPGSTTQAVTLKADFYRDNYSRVILTLLVLSLLLLGTAGALLFSVTNVPQPKFFAVDAQGRVIPALSLNEPNLAPPALLSWTNQAVSTVFNFDFLNYADQLNVAVRFFTDEGWINFKQAIERPDGLLNRVIQQKLTVSAVAREAPIIVDEGEKGDVHYWHLRYPLLVTYRGEAGVGTSETNLVDMTVVRVPVSASLSGVQIAQFEVIQSGIS